MASLGAGFVAANVWLYALSRMALMDSIFVDALVTVGFVVLAVIAYAATGGDEDSS